VVVYPVRADGDLVEKAACILCSHDDDHRFSRPVQFTMTVIRSGW
jgi:hypothetical protein